MIKTYKISLNFGLMILMIYAIFRIMHWPGQSFLDYATLITTLIYVIIGLMIIMRLKQVDLFEKGAWLIGFLIVPPVTGLIFYHYRLKKTNPNKSYKT